LVYTLTRNLENNLQIFKRQKIPFSLS